jgi:hypothetical protein
MKRGVAAMVAVSFFFLFVTSWSQQSDRTKPHAAPVALAVTAGLTLPPLKHRALTVDIVTPPLRSVLKEVSRSTPRPELPPPPKPTRRPVPVTSHSTYTPRRPAYTPAAQPELRTTGSIQAYARALVGSDWQFSCLAHIVDRESGWNTYAANPEGAYGIPQALPGAKMSSAGYDWRYNPETQIRWMLSYIAARYGTPCNAWNFWQGHSWY